MRTDLMSFFKKLKANMIINKKNEQTFYELAIREIATGQKRTGLWAIALSKSDGSLDKAHALYIGLLAEEIKNIIIKARKIKYILIIKSTISAMKVCFLMTNR